MTRAFCPRISSILREFEDSCAGCRACWLHERLQEIINASRTPSEPDLVVRSIMATAFQFDLSTHARTSWSPLQAYRHGLEGDSRFRRRNWNILRRLSTFTLVDKVGVENGDKLLPRSVRSRTAFSAAVGR